MKLSAPLHVIAARRLPQGRFGGSLAGIGSVGLSTALVRGIFAQTDLPSPTRVHWGIARSHTQGMNPARTITAQAGLPHSTFATTHNVACASGLAAVFGAAQHLALGGPGPVLAGGAEAMSDTPFLAPGMRWGLGLGHGEIPDVMHQDGLLCPITGLLMGETIEHLVARHGITREEADAYAAESHRRAGLGDFRAEHLVLPTLAEDECRRPGTTREELAALPPVFRPDGQITAGNASALSDGAACVLLARSGDTGLEPLARILGWSEVALDPMDMGYGPVPAVRTLLADHGRTVEDIRLWELNEAFAAQVLVCAHTLGLPMDRLNTAGGGISLGHPIGASGARILVTLIHQLRQAGGGLGVATLGIGGGLGQAVLVEV